VINECSKVHLLKSRKQKKGKTKIDKSARACQSQNRDQINSKKTVAAEKKQTQDIIYSISLE